MLLQMWKVGRANKLYGYACIWIRKLRRGSQLRMTLQIKCSHLFQARKLPGGSLRQSRACNQESFQYKAEQQEYLWNIFVHVYSFVTPSELLFHHLHLVQSCLLQILLLFSNLCTLLSYSYATCQRYHESIPRFDQQARYHSLRPFFLLVSLNLMTPNQQKIQVNGPFLLRCWIT